MIETIPEWALTHDDEAQINTLITRCFGDDFETRSYHLQRPHLRLIYRKNDQIIGHIALILRAVRLGSQITDTAGLAEVCTYPAHRGQSIASHLLQAAIAQARASQAAYLILFGTAALYAGQGFTRQSNILTYVNMANTRTATIATEPAETLMTLPLRSEIWPATAPLDMLGPLF
ncbi:MAG: GNAT family N-acetyltransferase [Pseudomonadota bacterium]